MPIINKVQTRNFPVLPLNVARAYAAAAQVREIREQRRAERLQKYHAAAEEEEKVGLVETAQPISEDALIQNQQSVADESWRAGGRRWNTVVQAVSLLIFAAFIATVVLVRPWLQVEPRRS